MLTRSSLVLAAALALAAVAPAFGAIRRDPKPADLAFPRYAHVIVIVEENEGFGSILGNRDAPTFTALAKAYGNATDFYAERHPSEPNYVAMIGGSTFGIRDDAAYPYHLVAGPNLARQLQSAGISWRGYFGAYDAAHPYRIFSRATRTEPRALYASKHNPFMNFSDLRPTLSRHLFGLSQLQRDLATGSLPGFAYVVPDQCDDMHGLRGAGVPADCDSAHPRARIARADRVLARLMREIQASRAWRSRPNLAIVVTFDESDGDRGPSGGRIPTIVVTNHGPRRVSDPTRYDHYALLRNIEDAFGIHAYLNQAGDWNRGVRPMTPLFAAGSR